jgi:hypothetical protein
MATLPPLTWAELDYLGAQVDHDVEAIEAALARRDQTDRERLTAEWSMANAMRTAIREAQYSVRVPEPADPERAS